MEKYNRDREDINARTFPGTTVGEALAKILTDAPELPIEGKPDSLLIWDMILANIRDMPAKEFAPRPKDSARA